LRPGNSKEKTNSHFANSGLQLINKNEITDNIIVALEKMSAGRKSAIKSRVPKLVRNIFESYAGVEGSRVHDSFKNGDLIYLSAAMQKPE
jgi:hypothetical protein